MNVFKVISIPVDMAIGVGTLRVSFGVTSGAFYRIPSGKIFRTLGVTNANVDLTIKDSSSASQEPIWQSQAGLAAAFDVFSSVAVVPSSSSSLYVELKRASTIAQETWTVYLVLERIG